MALTGAHAPGATPLREEDVRGLKIESITTQGELNEAKLKTPFAAKSGRCVLETPRSPTCSATTICNGSTPKCSAPYGSGRASTDRFRQTSGSSRIESEPT